ncbi:hypothetical protein COV88_01280 [Candidatus Saccharibacteria bacterium CG11_big_fil_rev_8_21_14_0_20_41_19]|nr:hypothetical protein [Candidatus Saccharibacteria bacterium]OIP86321.1 MAG: hypothetical protein AUK57_00925 [Candidatus Saccharibacteria bacterium CG2_30_41_52]PIQ71101.1 MAG: hypothetical protein COV88_01280 [Candidatus Saccharibacteria bacterium CG11_big_fil_rev_8_21_14_0_20_41_19]PIZ59918.1 MAG: hypothetical protein COY18_02040 [Candidatus Saccharibacteria bacterium CG_4_10_14_0_2_um_filter_41_11]PJC29371.1 MAG: hypothetical protein CO052_03710 [Candidatus Saccharibacteria bacterium CG_4
MLEKNRYATTNKIDSKNETYDESIEDNSVGRLVFLGSLAIALVASTVGADKNKGISNDVKYPSKLIEATKSLVMIIETVKSETPEINKIETIEPIKDTVKPVETTKNSGSITISATVLPAMSCDAELNCVTNNPDARIYKVEKDGVVTVVADY